MHQLEEQLKEEIEAALNEILPEAFATVREACRRLLGTTVQVTGREIQWDMVPYDVQLIGGIVLHESRIAEMATGEGKTLVATLPLYLNALPGGGAHLVTVNNYLARRDAQWMGHVLSYLGLDVRCLDDTEPSSPERRAAYEADITYGTNNEFGFDFLRDNMVFTVEQRVQRAHNYAIIDEVDSILVDEARTPLIISGPAGHEGDQKYAEFNARVKHLVRNQTAVMNELAAEAEPLVDKEDPDYDGASKLFQVQRGMPRNKRYMKLIQEPKVQQLVQRVELDYIADRKLPSRDQRFRELDDELYFVLDERGHSVHYPCADLDFVELPLGPENRRMQRLVPVGFGRCKVVLDPLLQGRPLMVDDTKHVITVGHAIDQYPNRHEVVDRVERLVLLLHLPIDGPEMLGPSGHLKILDASLHERFDQRLFQAKYHLFPLAAFGP